MLIYAKASLFLWAEAVATACYTQNHSIIRLRQFGALCYPTNNSENLGKLQLKADIAPEVIAPIAEVVAPKPVTSTGSPSSTTVDQDAPSLSNSQTTPETQSPVISNNVEEENHDLDVARMNNDPFFGILIPKNDSEASSSDVIPTIVQTELVPRPDYVWYYLIWFDKVKLDEFGESLKKYGKESSDPADTPMLEKSKLDEDTQGKVVDPTHYREMVGTLMYLIASRPDLTFVPYAATMFNILDQNILTSDSTYNEQVERNEVWKSTPVGSILIVLSVFDTFRYCELAEFDKSNTYVLERLDTSAGNHVQEILLKLNLPDHRMLKIGGKGT
ncbi:hypothetical protein Tco_0486877 [Tanacetum coccineum]